MNSLNRILFYVYGLNNEKKTVYFNVNYKFVEMCFPLGEILHTKKSRKKDRKRLKLIKC